MTGVENSYEKELRGTQGVKYVIRDTECSEGSFQNGKDSIAVNGKDLELTIDNELQKYAEQLMQNKKGSIVAIEPGSGEILALLIHITTPIY